MGEDLPICSYQALRQTNAPPFIGKAKEKRSSQVSGKRLYWKQTEFLKTFFNHAFCLPSSTRTSSAPKEETLTDIWTN